MAGGPIPDRCPWCQSPAITVYADSSGEVGHCNTCHRAWEVRGQAIAEVVRDMPRTPAGDKV